MHRNTYILVTFLAIFAALVAGVNIGKSMNPSSTEQTTDIATPSATPVLSVITPVSHTYTNTSCGVQLEYPSTFTLSEEATSSAVFMRSDAKDSILLTCQKDIPRPPIPTGMIETIRLTNSTKTATISAKLYHDSSPNDGSKVDALIFTNPKLQKDVFIAGYGADFDATLKTIRLYP